MEPDPPQPDPPQPPARDMNQAILAQLAEMTEMLLAQQQTINDLQQRQSALPSDAGSGSTPRVGSPRQGAIDAPPGNAPGDTASHQSGASELPAGSAAQNGIRALDPWKTSAVLSKDPFRPSFKLDGAKDYSVWHFTIVGRYF